MSVAICLACGQFKSNAFAPCPACGSRPQGIEALARQLLVTDAFSTTPSPKMLELAEKVKLAIASNQPLVFDAETLKIARDRVQKLLPKEAYDPPSLDYPLTTSDGLIQKLISHVSREPLLRNVGQPLAAARRDKWLPVDSWDAALQHATDERRDARLSGRVKGLYADAQARGGEALARYEKAMSRAAPFSQQLIAGAVLSSGDGRVDTLILRVVQLDLVASIMMIEYADSVDITDAKLALLVYSEGRFFASWVDGSDEVCVF